MGRGGSRGQEGVQSEVCRGCSQGSRRGAVRGRGQAGADSWVPMWVSGSKAGAGGGSEVGPVKPRGTDTPGGRLFLEKISSQDFSQIVGVVSRKGTFSPGKDKQVRFWRKTFPDFQRTWISCAFGPT